MNSESERKLSLAELKQLNMKQEQPAQEAHPTREDWDELMERLSEISRKMEQLNNRFYLSQIEKQSKEILDILWAMNRRQEQAGRKKERRFSLPRFYLPEIEWRLVAVAAMTLGGLFMTWWFLLRG